jgi:Ion transport protein
VLILIFVFSYTLIGMELFAFKLPSAPIDDFINPIKRRSTFNSFIESFFSVFIVLIGDGWTEIYFDHYRHLDPVTPSIFFMSLIILGQFILMNLFISVLIENFE